NVNITAAFLITKALLPGMIERGYGKIINTSSLGGRKGAAGRSAYRITKAGLRVRVVAIASQAALRDASGRPVCYVKQKAFKLTEAVTVFGDEAQQRPVYRITADCVIDISAQYRIDDVEGRPLGVVHRRGMRSFWRALYEIGREGQLVFVVQEENPWVKVANGALTQIPVLGLFAGYLFHLAYRVTRADTGAAALRVAKRPAFLEVLCTTSIRRARSPGTTSASWCWASRWCSCSSGSGSAVADE
ncbi:MAG: SDR family NAD(P)-dependent oxidoreductase, partial [Betaproteobacteria bacterium]